jgi:hypothetical protein
LSPVSPRSPVQEKLESLICSSTLILNAEIADKKPLLAKLERDKRKLLERINPDGDVSEYDKQRKIKIAAIKAENDRMIREKYAYLTHENHKNSTAQRQENERELRRKVKMEQQLMQQFGQLEGCLNQFDVI